MPDEKKFDELLSEAPLAINEGTTSLVGALQRSREPGKFVLVLSSGRNVTLNASDVKEHEVLGSMIGQPLVRVMVDSDKVPEGVTRELFSKNPVSDTFNKAPAPDLGYTVHEGNLGIPVDPDWFQHVYIDPALASQLAFAMATASHRAPAATAADRVISVRGPNNPHGPTGLTDVNWSPNSYAWWDLIRY